MQLGKFVKVTCKSCLQQQAGHKEIPSNLTFMGLSCTIHTYIMLSSNYLTYPKSCSLFLFWRLIKTMYKNPLWDLSRSTQSRLQTHQSQVWVWGPPALYPAAGPCRLCTGWAGTSLPRLLSIAFPLPNLTANSNETVSAHIHSIGAPELGEKKKKQHSDLRIISM